MRPSSPPDELLLIDRDSYPTVESAQSLLRSMYQDRAISIDHATPSHWHARVWWQAFTHDPALADACRIVFDVSAEESVRIVDETLLAGRIPVTTMLHHSWSLHAWTRWWTASAATVAPTVVHLDAHDDLARPCLSSTAEPGIFRDPLGDAVDVFDQDQVADAILRGYVGIGSFARPFLAAVPGTTYLWVRPGEPLPPIADGSGPVLLDIDMDYFDNSLDTCRDDPPVPTGHVLDLIRAFGGQLRAWKPRARVAAVTIALSPGFFPARHWADGLAGVTDELRSALG